MTSIHYYSDFLSDKLKEEILKNSFPLFGIPGLLHTGESKGLENSDSLTFLCHLYNEVKDELNKVLTQRIADRRFLDERTNALYQFNTDSKIDYLSPKYQTTLGLEDGNGRIVFGPLRKNYFEAKNKPVSQIPDYLRGNHVTLFGPPDTEKMSINAMNAYHRKMNNEPAIIETLLKLNPITPKWGADDEDSKTPLREDLISAGVNLTGCLNKTLSFEDKKKYQLEKENLSLPIKRFPGLALPSLFLFLDEEPIPLHLYDFALHLFENWHNRQALNFYVPKLENEEEAKYLKNMILKAEQLIKEIHPSYEIGSIRLMIVLENPRAIFRVNEIMDELYPYFVGASLGWHDYLASTARLFKEDANYRIPVKADPDIVIKYIKASHDILADVVGPRGGIKVGGMYGILPIDQDLNSDSYQLTLKGYFKDVITQMKRELDGFWVAHPDFVRLGLALVSAWKELIKGNDSYLKELVTSLFQPKYQEEILSFIFGNDISGLDKNDPLYSRSIIVADIKESNFIPNNHPDEIRYNVFQSLQYITDWLSGNGCVALPAHIGDTPVRVMDDLATAERSRWEVWHELYHKRFQLEDFLKIVHEEYNFIRKDLSNKKKIVQVKWNKDTEKWYPVAKNLMIKLMTDHSPVEFATQLLLPFTIQEIRYSPDPWKKAVELDREKFQIREEILRFNYYFEICGSVRFAHKMSQNLLSDFISGEEVIHSFSKTEIIEAASFHGDIGENKKSLDHFAKKEQEKVSDNNLEILNLLQEKGKEYKNKFGMKFLISAANKDGHYLLDQLTQRMNNTMNEELHNARSALWEISLKRLTSTPFSNLKEKIIDLKNKFEIQDVQMAISERDHLQEISIGNCPQGSLFEIASLSKTIASAFAIEYFTKKNIPLNTSVNLLLSKTKSAFRIPNGDDVLIENLMNHTALNLHYVHGIPLEEVMPPVADFLNGNNQYGYDPVKVINKPGTKFNYSGGGFLVLEHLLEALEEKTIDELTRPFLNALGMDEFTFNPKDQEKFNYANGFSDDGIMLACKRKMFPAFAAGGLGTSRSVGLFLSHLEKAYQQKNQVSPISHDTARLMLQGIDKGSMDFMGAKVGLGVFIGEAGENKLAIHQGANDGFRAIYVHCFDGPDLGKGFVIFCNTDNKGTLFISSVAQLLLKELKFSGINYELFNDHFDWSSLPQEQIVNLGYKQLVFNSFLPNLPEEILNHGPLDSLAVFNILNNAKILNCTNQKFARAENLISKFLPLFEPELFGKQGKIMDSWETVRHNDEGVDELELEISHVSEINYIFISTKYHFGNHAPFISLEGFYQNQWITFLEKTSLEGHSELRIKLETPTLAFSKIRVKIYPDGGLTRLGLYRELPHAEKSLYKPLREAKSVLCKDLIPQTQKPLSIKYEINQDEIEENWNQLMLDEEFNIASQFYGAKIISASNEHYAPAIQVISPYSPLNMFDGLESSRSRVEGNSEYAHIEFFKPGKIHRIELDFKFFVNNNPKFISIIGFTETGEIELVSKTNVKAFAGSEKVFNLNNSSSIKGIKLKTYPCGGLNRIKVYARKSK